MNKGIFLVFVLFGGIISRPALAQVNVTVPDYFDQFFNNYYLLNPANTDTSYKVKINVGDKSETGLLEGVRKIYVDGDLKLETGRKGMNHFIGVQVVNSKDGDFISRSRFYGRYSWRAMITQNSSLSAGISMGFVNYAFKASQSGAGGVACVGDGDIFFLFFFK